MTLLLGEHVKILLISLIAALVSGLLTTAHGAVPAFYLEREGIQYLCQATSAPDPNGNRLCVDKAYAGPFSREDSIQLCRASFSTAPADCAIKMYAGPFSKSETLRACASAISIGPADCAIKLYTGPFSKEETLQVCGRLSTLAHADCALKAYAGPYSKSESIEMCRSDILNTARAVRATTRQSLPQTTKQTEIRAMQQIKLLESQAVRLQRQVETKK